MDMNNQKARENVPPSFRPAEVGDSGRRFVGLNRVFESAILRLWGGFTPLAQPTVWTERGRKEKRKGKSRARIENRDGRRRPSLCRRADLRHARCYSSSVQTTKTTEKIAQKLLLLFLYRCAFSRGRDVFSG